MTSPDYIPVGSSEVFVQAQREGLLIHAADFDTVHSDLVCHKLGQREKKPQWIFNFPCSGWQERDGVRELEMVREYVYVWVNVYLFGLGRQGVTGEMES